MPLTDEDLLADLRAVADEVGRPPSVDEYKDHGSHGFRTFYSRFGSWPDALEAAGFEPREPAERIPDDQLIAELHRLADELGRRPRKAELTEHDAHSSRTYQKRFGSWTNALKAAGFDTDDIVTPLSRAELIAELERVAAEVDSSPPTTRDMDEHGAYWASTYKRRFGSWSAAIEAVFDDDAESHGSEE